jgi:hypothetical protein
VNASPVTEIGGTGSAHAVRFEIVTRRVTDAGISTVPNATPPETVTAATTDAVSSVETPAASKTAL